MDTPHSFANLKKQNAIFVGKRDMFAVACQSKRKRQYSFSTQKLLEEEQFLNGLHDLGGKPIIKVLINGITVPMEIDMGAAVSVIPRKKVSSIRLQRTTKKLRSATGQILKLAGEATVKVQVQTHTKELKLFVAHGDCPSLFGTCIIPY